MFITVRKLSSCQEPGGRAEDAGPEREPLRDGGGGRVMDADRD